MIYNDSFIFTEENFNCKDFMLLSVAINHT